jgi:thiol:disulfide interchange protein DsbD
MDREVFSDKRVVEMSRRFVTLRFDLTRKTPSQDDILRMYKVRGVPTILFFDRNGKEIRALRIGSYVDKFEFLGRMEHALNLSKSG